MYNACSYKMALKSKKMLALLCSVMLLQITSAAFADDFEDVPSFSFGNIGSTGWNAIFFTFIHGDGGYAEALTEVGEGTYPRGVKPCANFPCIFWANHKGIFRQSEAGQWLRFSMCPDCQEEYKKADFDKIHRNLMDYFKKTDKNKNK